MTSPADAEGEVTNGDAPPGEAPQAADALGAGVVGAVVGFTVLALSQPILDLLGRNPEFFVARQAPTLDVLLLVLVLALGLPLVAGGLVLLAHVAHPRAGRMVAGGAIAILVATIVVRVAENWRPGISGWIAAGVAILAGIAVSFGLARSASFRSITTFGLLLPLILVVQSTFFSPLRTIVNPSGAEGGKPAEVSRPGDVVVLVFDEFPLASLLTREARIDAQAFPNLARLAGDAVWYRNASTVHHFTLQAVPSLLTGRRPRVGALARVSDHPHNLFTLLRGTHEVVAHEPLTALCPDDLCPPDHEPFVRRWGSLSRDVAVLSGHAVLPRRLRRELPPVDEAWGGFGEDGPTVEGTGLPEIQSVLHSSDPAADLSDFIEEIRDRDGPGLYFHHSLLPHVPWRHLPDGTVYPQPSELTGTTTAPGRPGVFWGDDEWTIAQGYQRHLVQAMYVDRLLGRVMDRLQAEGLYERATIVVSSDHGASFYPSTPRRQRSPTTLGGIAAIPLFVKMPGQGEGTVSDAPVESIDVLPTILDILDAETRAEDGIEGTSLLGPLPEERARFLGAPQKAMPYPGPEELDSAVEHKFSLLGQSGLRVDPWSIAPEGGRTLLGDPVPANPPIGPSGIRIEGGEAFQQVDPSSGVLPAFVQMELEERGPGILIAVALEGRVVAVTRTHLDEGVTRATALLPPARFQEGSNDLRVFEVDPDGKTLRELLPD